MLINGRFFLLFRPLNNLFLRQYLRTKQVLSKWLRKKRAFVYMYKKKKRKPDRKFLHKKRTHCLGTSKRQMKMTNTTSYVLFQWTMTMQSLNLNLTRQLVKIEYFPMLIKSRKIVKQHFVITLNDNRERDAQYIFKNFKFSDSSPLINDHFEFLLTSNFSYTQSPNFFQSDVFVTMRESSFKWPIPFSIPRMLAF